MTLLLCCISTHLTFQVSQGSATTDLRWGENFNKLLFHCSFLNIVVKKLRKSVNICQSYRKNKSGTFFYGPRCTYCNIHNWQSNSSRRCGFLNPVSTKTLTTVLLDVSFELTAITWHCHQSHVASLWSQMSEVIILRSLFRCLWFIGVVAVVMCNCILLSVCLCSFSALTLLFGQKEGNLGQ